MRNKSVSKFKEKVVQVVNLVPYGKIVSYGQVALYVGMPGAGRQVGWILRGLSSESNVPWWRVVNNQGRVSIKGSVFSAEDQRRLLISEGVDVRSDMSFDIERYRFLPDDKFIRSLELDSLYLAMVADKLYNN